MAAQQRQAETPPPPTELMREAYVTLSGLPDERQDEIAQMLLDIVRGELSTLALTPKQQAEVETAISDDEPFASDEEVDAFLPNIKHESSV